ncbi:MAG: heat-inducible transcriptional repressor HrcA [Oscillospiraceae bacterium]|jgi:heat-inducible transcriptional repressor|nr:heat-inducible transcriptional repressor HrcA [Oscillospiraceae bacterium]
MSERGFKILEAIIDEYIRTGEPIGSKFLAERLCFPVSSATVRNEMASLEQQGYLDHPHTSAGRIPTVKGYRLYIERLALENPEKRPLLSDEDKYVIDSALEGVNADSDEVIIESASRALAELTKCAVVSTSNLSRFSVITKVEVIPTGKRMYVLLLITSGGNIKNRVCRLSFDLTHEQLDFFTKFANENLAGQNPENISEEYIKKIGSALGSYMISLSPLLKAVADLSGEMTGSRVNFEGESNLIAFEDFRKNEILSILESRDAFTGLLDNAFSGISVLFGGESEGRGDTFAVSNSGLIAGSFLKHGKTAGSFGVIGPMRLDYKKLIPYIEYFAVKVTGLLSEDDEEEGGG